ncbi:MAG: flagellar biosynthetic protein FliO [Fervidobacterium sp.]|nr:flagellar biosynthetic protein FliO [Fervidobacterium sp.]
MFIVVLLITYWFLKRKLPNMVGGRFAKVISKVYIDRSTSLVLVRILKEYYVILIGPNKAEVIQKLDTIDEGEIEKPENFQSVLNKYVGGKK